MAHPAEAETLRAFIASSCRQERLVSMLTTKKRQAELDRALSHEDLWDERYVRNLAADEQNATVIATLLRERGASETCRVLGGTRDGEELALDVALNEIVGTLDACLVICTAGRPAYHESEDLRRRAILVRE